jgi:hypothetical protein
VIVTVAAEEPGEAEIAGLGLIAAVTPVAPAIFDLLPERPGSYEVLFAPTGADRSRTAGTLVVAR